MTPRRPTMLRASFTQPPAGRSGFTLIELMTVLIIFSIFSSLSLAGLALSRQRAKAIRTETTIRKIHEVVMPHYERYLGRSPPSVNNSPFFGGVDPRYTNLSSSVRGPYERLVWSRRLQAIELPDSWLDLVKANGVLEPDRAWDPGRLNLLEPDPALETAISRRLRGVFGVRNPPLTKLDTDNADAECLWAIVMQGGFGDPGIIGHFREDEFGDTNKNGLREFIDGWGKPIRFLRWAPGFVSKYQPAPPSTPADIDTRSHDVFDSAAIDPLARITLFPLIFSGGPNGEPDIVSRVNAPAPVLYSDVSFDPYFATRPLGGLVRAHLYVPRPNGNGIPVAPYLGPPPPPSLQPFGTPLNPDRPSDNIHNHALSR